MTSMTQRKLTCMRESSGRLVRPTRFGGGLPTAGGVLVCLAMRIFPKPSTVRCHHGLKASETMRTYSNRLQPGPSRSRY
jgi:hypothetical protein